MLHIAVESFSDWRRQARQFLQRKVDPASVSWTPAGESGQQQGLMFAGDELEAFPVVNEQPCIPVEFLGLAERVACFRSDDRWALLYRLAWRLVYENRRLLSDELDKDTSLCLSRSKTIARDVHKMHAFVRFKEVSVDDGESLFLAWFEPAHDIVERASDFFVKRFHNMHWSILTPSVCVHWHRQELLFTPGCSSPPEIDDEIEGLWLNYYQSIFNPARLKVDAMCAEMPKKYWRNLPESRLIPGLISSASRQTKQMIDAKVVQETHKLKLQKRSLQVHRPPSTSR